MKDVYILGIESSCDDTSISIVKNGRYVLSNVISSQIDIHNIYGGVVPEIASRKHLENIKYVYKKALDDAHIKLSNIDCIAVTYGPGLIGSLLVGLSFAKGLALANNIPFIGINHIEGHIYANYISNKNLEPPFISLIVSGGHTYLIKVIDYNTYKIYGKTYDDACGEVYDKIARTLNLGYPGGPYIDKRSNFVYKDLYNFPRGNIKNCPYDFTFSGLKSHVINFINNKKQKLLFDKYKNLDIKLKDIYLDDETINNICYSFQESVTDSLVNKTIMLCDDLHINKIAICGGVSANTKLREKFKNVCKFKNFEFYYPEIIYCTDNAAMIASTAYYKFLNKDFSKFSLNADANLEFEEK